MHMMLFTLARSCGPGRLPSGLGAETQPMSAHEVAKEAHRRSPAMKDAITIEIANESSSEDPWTCVLNSCRVVPVSPGIDDFVKSARAPSTARRHLSSDESSTVRYKKPASSTTQRAQGKQTRTGTVARRSSRITQRRRDTRSETEE